MSVVLPAKGDRVLGHGDEPVIRDCDAVGVPREVVEHMGRTAKGRLGVHDPRLAIERSEKGAKGHLRLQRGEGAREIEPAVAKAVSEASHELAAKDLP